VGGERGFLHARGRLRVEPRRAEILRAALRVLVLVIVEPADRHDLDDRKRLVAENADGQLESIDELLDENLLVLPEAVGERGVDAGRVANDVNAHARSLARRFHHEWQRQRGARAGADDFPIGGRHSGGFEAFLALDFVKREAAPNPALARVGDPARVEDRLELAVLAEGAVDDVEGEVRAGGEIEGRVAHVEALDGGADRAQGIGDGGARSQRDVALGAGSAHEDGDAFSLEQAWGKNGFVHSSFPTI